MIEEAEERVLPIEKLDRLERDNFRRYMKENPFYAKEVFGFIPTDAELDDYIEQNKELFYDDVAFKLPDRRRLK